LRNPPINDVIRNTFAVTFLFPWSGFPPAPLSKATTL